MENNQGSITCQVVGNSIRVTREASVNRLSISFQRTPRLSGSAKADWLPASLGTFPLYPVRKYAANLPGEMVAKGGLFTTMPQNEAMRISFKALCPFMIKIYVGDINIISTEPAVEKINTKLRLLRREHVGESIQDYVVCPDQPQLDGAVNLAAIGSAPAMFRQFVATKIGDDDDDDDDYDGDGCDGDGYDVYGCDVYGYDVEARITGKELVGGLRLEITPSKAVPSHASDGKPVVFVKCLDGEQATVAFDPSTTKVIDLIKQLSLMFSLGHLKLQLNFKWGRLEDSYLLSQCGIKNYSALELVDGNEDLSQARERVKENCGFDYVMGLFRQRISADPYSPDTWDEENTFAISIQVLNTSEFHRVVGQERPPTGASAAHCEKAGPPLPDIGDCPGGVKDPDGLIDPAGPLRKFRTVTSLHSELAQQLRSLNPDP